MFSCLVCFVALGITYNVEAVETYFEDAFGVGGPLADWPTFTEHDKPSINNCTLQWFQQRMDHYSFEQGKPKVYSQRWFYYDKFYTQGGPLFFYLGNEAAVDLYINNTGLMWELGRQNKALLVFAEHRYYGESKLFEDGTPSCMKYMTMEQAMGDYAVLIRHVQERWNMQKQSATIGFGGSYGGMLGAWFRYKYPHVLDGAIAASAPIFAQIGADPQMDKTGEVFGLGVLEDTGPVCADRHRESLKAIFRLSESEEGRSRIVSHIPVCGGKLETKRQAQGIADVVTDMWGNLAMGEFPYPSSYLPFAIGQGNYELPAFPIKAACKPFENLEDLEESSLLSALSDSLQVWFNVSGKAECFYDPSQTPEDPDKPDPVTTCGGDYGFQQCTELLAISAKGLSGDMFYPATPFNLEAAIEECRAKYNVEPALGWGSLQYGDRVIDTVANMRNIVFSNGRLDPWKALGVDCSWMPCHESVISPLIYNGAHHIDLMFSHPLDTPDIRSARRLEATHISRWISEKKVRHAAVSSYESRAKQKMGVGPERKVSSEVMI